MYKKIFLLLLGTFLFSSTESINAVSETSQISKSKANLQNKYNLIIKKINEEPDIKIDTTELIFKTKKQIGFVEYIM